MSSLINIENMNIEEKFLVMEQIWSKLNNENIKECNSKLAFRYFKR